MARAPALYALALKRNWPPFRSINCAISCSAAATPKRSSCGFWFWDIEREYNPFIMTIASINPGTGETLKNFDALTAAQIEEKLQLAADTFRTYRHTPLNDRAAWMQRVAQILENDKHALGKMMTAEMGKPIKAAIAEAEKCAWVCRYYAENAQHHLADQVVETNAQKSYVRFQPLGPVLAVMPWNVPFWQVFRFAAPA